VINISHLKPTKSMKRMKTGKKEKGKREEEKGKRAEKNKWNNKWRKEWNKWSYHIHLINLLIKINLNNLIFN